MQILKIIWQRYTWLHPVSAILCIGFYILMLRPLRVLFNGEVQLPFFRWIFEYQSQNHVTPDAAGTGVLLHVPDMNGVSEYMAVIAVPGGLIFILTLIGLILIASPPRYLILLPAIHLFCYVAALFFGTLAGFMSPLLIHFVTLFQHYLLPAVSFALLFLALWEIKKSAPEESDSGK